MIKNVIFDNGGVIVKYSYNTYLDYFCFVCEVQNKLNSIFLTNEWEELSKGNITTEEFLNKMVNLYPDYKKEISEILDYTNLKYLLPVYKETIEFIKLLRKNKIRTYLLTDIVEDTIKYLNETINNFECLFDGIVYSNKVHMLKKEGIVFDYIINKFKLNPEETLFIDDTLVNIEQAKKRNILTYRFLNVNDIDDIKKLVFNNNDIDCNK